MTPLTNEEIKELLTETLEGPLPVATMQRVMATLAETRDLREQLAEIEQLLKIARQ